MSALSRRQILAATSSMTLSLAAPRAMAQESGTPEASPAASGLQTDGSWRFTDDRGIEAITEGLPSHIIAQTTAAAALWDFGIKPVGIFGPSRLADGTPALQAGNLDLDTVEVLGDYGAFDGAKRLDEKAGYVSVGVGRNYYGHGHDGIWMRKFRNDSVK